MENRSGSYKIQLSGAAQYRSFVPASLQAIDLRDMENSFLLAETNHMLGVLDVLSSKIPDIDLFISMYIRKEALLSSQIEGTQATLDDILDPAAEKNVNINVSEVLNYIKALHYALGRMETLPLCGRLLRETHRVLLTGIRGGDKNPGEFRRSQNWIGPAGSTINTATYIPPNPEDMDLALDDLDRFMNADKPEGDPLIRSALIHYQFETIHPFLDGNGRIGRMLTTLFLCNKKILSKPTLYMSCYLKEHRTEYYDRLTEVRKRGNYEQWVEFFIRGILEIANDAITTIDRLSSLRKTNLQKIATQGRSAKAAQNLYSYIEQNPIMEIGKAAGDMGISYNTAAKATEHLGNLGILKQTGENRRNRCFAYTDYLDILRQGT